MDRERLTHLLADPGNVAKQDLAGLEELAVRYPWFSAAHLLLAVGEHSAGEVLFDERARTTAAHVPSRSVLFDLVHAEPVAHVDVAPVTIPQVAPVLSVAHAQAAPVPAEVIAAAPIIAAAAVPPAPPPFVQPAPPEATMPPMAVEVPAALVSPVVDVLPAPVGVIAPPALVEIVTPASSPVASPVVATEEVDPLDQLIRQSALASGYELVLEHSLPPVAPAATDAAPIEGGPPASSAVAPSGVATSSAPAPAPAPVPIPSPKPTGRLRFTDWLSAEEGSVVPQSPPVAAPTQAPDTQDWIRTSPSDAAAQITPAPAVPEAVAAPVVDPFTLIDRFIRQEHPEPVKRAEFFTPQQAAKRSLEDHAELVTETLARIYEKQGNVAKAIAAYKRLAERQPDRSAHFLELAKTLEGRGKA